MNKNFTNGEISKFLSIKEIEIGLDNCIQIYP